MIRKNALSEKKCLIEKLLFHVSRRAFFEKMCAQKNSCLNNFFRTLIGTFWAFRWYFCGKFVTKSILRVTRIYSRKIKLFIKNLFFSLFSDFEEKNGLFKRNSDCFWQLCSTRPEDSKLFLCYVIYLFSCFEGESRTFEMNLGIVVKTAFYLSKGDFWRK